MSDLISRSKLLKALSEAEDNYKAEHHDCVMDNDPFSDGILSAMFSVFKIVKLQPTAYSVDKVVAELKKELSLADKEKERCTGENNLQFDSAKGYASGISTAIEIVKQEVE